MKERRFNLFTDGGSRGNPGQAAWGFIICDNGKIIEEHSAADTCARIAALGKGETL